MGIEGNATKLKGWLVDDLEERKTTITTVWGWVELEKLL